MTDDHAHTRPEPHEVEVGSGRLDSIAAPVLIMVDCQRLFTLAAAKGTALEAAVQGAGRAARAAREHDIPVVWLRTVYADENELGPVWRVKAPALTQLRPGGDMAELDERIGYRAGEQVVTKKRASGFVGTELDTLLRQLGVRTCAIAGFTTAGCVRATAVDAASLDYCPVVLSDAVADRTKQVHDTSLLDLDARYADVTATADWFAALTSSR